MKIYLTKNDVLEILAGHFGLTTMDVSTQATKETVLVTDELYWGGHDESS